MISSFSERKGEVFKKDAWRYEGVLYIGCSRENLWDGECWKVNDTKNADFILWRELTCLSSASCEQSLWAFKLACAMVYFYKKMLTTIRRWITMRDIKGKRSFWKLRQVTLRKSSRPMTKRTVLRCDINWWQLDLGIVREERGLGLLISMIKWMVLSLGS